MKNRPTLDDLLMNDDEIMLRPNETEIDRMYRLGAVRWERLVIMGRISMKLRHDR